MARSLKLAAGLLVTVSLAGCLTAPFTKTSTQRLNQVLSTQQQAEAAYKSGDMVRAATLYQQLTKTIPQEANYWYMLGNTYVRTEQPDQAVQAYQQAVARNPNHTRAWHNLGIVRMRQAMAAFVSSASTAKPEDPMHEISSQLVDALTRISSGTGTASGAKSQEEVSTVSALPVSVSRPTAGSAARLTTEPTVRRRPGTPSTTPPTSHESP
jgi:hypothetical protein